jgi:hypothetical protein
MRSRAELRVIGPHSMRWLRTKCQMSTTSKWIWVSGAGVVCFHHFQPI